MQRGSSSFCCLLHYTHTHAHTHKTHNTHTDHTHTPFANHTNHTRARTHTRIPTCTLTVRQARQSKQGKARQSKARQGKARQGKHKATHTDRKRALHPEHSVHHSFHQTYEKCWKNASELSHNRITDRKTAAQSDKARQSNTKQRKQNIAEQGIPGNTDIAQRSQS